MATGMKGFGRNLDAPYAPDEIDRIIEKLEPRPDFSRRDCVSECQWIACWAVSAQQGTAIPPSERARFFTCLAGAAGNLNQYMREIPRHWGYLIQASQNLANRGHPPPGAHVEWVDMTDARSGEPEPHMAVWHVEDQVDRDLFELQQFMMWLKRCATFAAEHADAEKTKPGNRRSEWVEIAVGGFLELYRRVSSKPATAHKDREEGTAQGTLIDFLECALRPLGFAGDRMAILRLVEAVKKQPPSPLVRIGRREDQ